MQLSEKKEVVLSFLIWLSITLFYCYQLVLRVLPNIINHDIMAGFNIGASEFGSFAGLYYVGYIALHIPIGLALTKVGARKVIPACIALTALGLVPLVYNMGWNSAILGRILTGIGSSAASVGALQIFRIIYPSKFSRMLGLMVSIGLITAVYAGKPITNFILTVGVSAALNIILYLGIALAIFTYFLMPKSTEETSNSNIIADIKSVLLNPRLLFASLFAGLMIGPIEGFADAWGSTFLVNVYGIDKIVADSMTLSIFLGMSIGCIILPFITDKTGYYFGVTIASGLGMIACFAYILTGNADSEFLSYVCMIIGIFSAYQVVILAKTATFVSEERSGIAGAVANMIMMTFGWFFHTMIGQTLDNSWSGEVSGGIRQYSSDAFIKSISIIPSSMIVAVIGLSILSATIFIKARRVKKAEN